MGLVNIIESKAINFDDAINIVKEFDEIINTDIKEFLIKLKEKEKEDEIKSDLDKTIKKIEDYGAEKVYGYGYQGISIIEELKKILEAKDIKKAINELIDKLEKIKAGYGYPSVNGCLSVDKKQEGMAETVNLMNQEICSVGNFTARGVKITQEDLNEIAENWVKLKDRVKPPIKIGHFGEGFGMPAVGWVDNIRVEGDKLIADFRDVPKKVADLIRYKAYRRVSPELYVDFEEDGMKHGKVLKAVSILGADIPQIKTLKDLEVLYNTDEAKSVDFVIDEKEKEDNIDSPVKKILEENIRLKIDNFIEKNSNKVIPSIEPLVREVLKVAYMQELDVKFTEKEKIVNMSLGDAIKEIFNRLPDIVDLEEKAKSIVDTHIDEEALIKETAQKFNISETDAVRKLIREGKIKFFIETENNDKE